MLSMHTPLPHAPPAIISTPGPVRAMTTCSLVWRRWRLGARSSVYSMHCGSTPPTHFIRVQAVESACEGQRAHAAEHLASVALHSRHHAEPSIPVLALEHVLHCCRHVECWQALHQRAAQQRSVDEPRVHLSPLVALERAIVSLQGLAVCMSACSGDVQLQTCTVIQQCAYSRV
jgi:hypothetical protein